MFFSHQVFACLLEHSSDRAKLFLAGHHVRQRSQIYFDDDFQIFMKVLTLSFLAGPMLPVCEIILKNIIVYLLIISPTVPL